MEYPTARYRKGKDMEEMLDIERRIWIVKMHRKDTLDRDNNIPSMPMENLCSCYCMAKNKIRYCK